MELGSIEVSGIERVVFNRKSVWKRLYYEHTRDYVWYPQNANTVCPMRQATMVERLKRLAASPNHKVWVHGDTINIVSL